jgi:hypothetical protein
VTVSLAGRRYVTAMQAHQLPHKRQANPKPALHATGGRGPLHKGFKHTREQFRSDSGAAILHCHNRPARICLDTYIDFTAGLGNFNALLSKLFSIWSMRTASPLNQTLLACT